MYPIQGFAFLYRDNKSFIYTKVSIAKSYNKLKSNCGKIFKQDILPQYPIVVFLSKERITISIDQLAVNNNRTLAYTINLDDNSLRQDLFVTDKATIEFNSCYKIDKNKVFYREIIDLGEKAQELFLRQVFIDFLFDFFQRDVFKNSNYYDEVKKNLLKSDLINALLSKANFYLIQSSAKFNGSYFHLKYLHSWINNLEKQDAQEYLKEEFFWFDDLYLEHFLVSMSISENYSNFKKVKLLDINIIRERAFDWALRNLQYIEAVKLSGGPKWLLYIFLAIVLFIFIPQFLLLLVAFVWAFDNNFSEKIFNFFNFKRKKEFLNFNSFRYAIKLLSFEMLAASAFVWLAFKYDVSYVIGSLNLNLGVVVFISLVLFAFTALLLWGISDKINWQNAAVIALLAFLWSFLVGIVEVNLFPRRYHLLDNHVLIDTKKAKLMRDIISPGSAYIFKSLDSVELKGYGKIYLKYLDDSLYLNNGHQVKKYAFNSKLEYLNFTHDGDIQIASKKELYPHGVRLYGKILFYPLSFILIWASLGMFFGVIAFIVSKLRIKTNI